MKLYTLQPNEGRRKYAGKFGTNQQILASLYKDKLALLIFDEQGSLQEVFFSPSGEAQKTYILDFILKYIFPNVFEEGPILVQEFYLAEYEIGVKPLSLEYEDFIANMSSYSDEEKLQYEDEIRAWEESGEFVFYWLNDYTCNQEGFIIET